MEPIYIWTTICISEPLHGWTKVNLLKEMPMLQMCRKCRDSERHGWFYPSAFYGRVEAKWIHCGKLIWTYVLHIHLIMEGWKYYSLIIAWMGWQYLHCWALLWLYVLCRTLQHKICQSLLQLHDSLLAEGIHWSPHPDDGPLSLHTSSYCTSKVRFCA